MWRFILLTFAFLGWSFYVLSGGADYEPRTQSWQARAKLDDVRPLARPTPVAVASLTTGAEDVDDTEVSRADIALDTIEIQKDGDAVVTVATLETSEAPEPTFEADTAKVEDLTATPDIATAPEIAEDAQPAAADSALDIRKVSGTVVNMRDGPSTFYLAIGKLKQGDQVEVLEDNAEGWLKIRVTETGQTGWMADWLVTAAAAN